MIYMILHSQIPITYVDCRIMIHSKDQYCIIWKRRNNREVVNVNYTSVSVSHQHISAVLLLMKSFVCKLQDFTNISLPSVPWDP